MTDTRTLVFPDPAYRYATDEGVSFWGQDGARRVKFKISREALDDHFSDRDRLRPEDAFLKHRGEIQSLARRKYLTGQVESDGSVLIGNSSSSEAPEVSSPRRRSKSGSPQGVSTTRPITLPARRSVEHLVGRRQRRLA